MKKFTTLFKKSTDWSLWYDLVIQENGSVEKSINYFGLKSMRIDDFVVIKIIFFWFVFGVAIKMKDPTK